MKTAPSISEISIFRRDILLGAIVACSAVPAWSQFRVEVSGVGLTQLPIAVLSFRGEAQSPVKISAVILAASGNHWSQQISTPTVAYRVLKTP